MSDASLTKRALVFIIIFGIFILTFLVLRQILIPIVFGLLFAYIFNPVFRAINSKVKGRGLSALILLLAIAFLVVTPLVYLLPVLVKQTFDTYVFLQNYDFLPIFKDVFGESISNSISANFDNLIGKAFSTFLDQFTQFLVNLPSFLLQFAVFLFTFFFAVKDSDKMKKYVSSLSPFSTSTNEKFQKEFRGITDAIIFGQVLIGLIQGLAVGAGLFFLGVPKALVLTFVAIIFSIIPVLGSWVVWLPTGLVLLARGETFSGTFMIIYGALFVSTVDNILRPYILSKKSTLPIALSVIGTIGGLYFFGLSGLVLGPLVLAYTIIIIEFYRQGKLDELFKK